MVLDPSPPPLATCRYMCASKPRELLLSLVLQHVCVCCSVLQCVEGCSSAHAIWSHCCCCSCCKMPSWVAVCYIVLQCATLCCSVLHCVAVRMTPGKTVVVAVADECSRPNLPTSVAVAVAVVAAVSMCLCVRESERVCVRERGCVCVCVCVCVCNKRNGSMHLKTFPQVSSGVMLHSRCSRELTF